MPCCVRLRGLQEDLAVRAPADPRRLFAETVEAQQVCEQALKNVFPDMLDTLTRKLTTYIDNRLAAARLPLATFEHRRSTPYAIANGSDKPFSIPMYLNEKEQVHPEFKKIRKQYSVAFGMLVSVLKQDAHLEVLRSCFVPPENWDPEIRRLTLIVVPLI